MFTAPWHLFATWVHVDFAKERQIPILHYSPGSALLPKLGQSQGLRSQYMCRLCFEPFLLGGCWTEGLAPGFGEDQKLQRRRSCDPIWPSGSCQFSRFSRRVRRKANLFSQPWRARQGSQISPDQRAQTAQTAALHGAFGRFLWQVFGGFPLHFSSADKAVVRAVTCSFGDFSWGVWRGPGKHRNTRIWFAIMWWSLQSNLGWKLELGKFYHELTMSEPWKS